MNRHDRLRKRQSGRRGLIAGGYRRDAVGLLDHHDAIAALAIGGNRRCTSTRRFADQRRISTPGDGGLQRGDIVRRRAGGNGIDAELQIIERELRIASDIEHAAIRKLHLHDSIRGRLDDFFGVYLVAHTAGAHDAISADYLRITHHDFDGTDFCFCAAGCGHGELRVFQLAVG